MFRFFTPLHTLPGQGLGARVNCVKYEDTENFRNTTRIPDAKVGVLVLYVSPCHLDSYISRFLTPGLVGPSPPLMLGGVTERRFD